MRQGHTGFLSHLLAEPGSLCSSDRPCAHPHFRSCTKETAGWTGRFSRSGWRRCSWPLCGHAQARRWPWLSKCCLARGSHGREIAVHYPTAYHHGSFPTTRRRRNRVPQEEVSAALPGGTHSIPHPILRHGRRHCESSQLWWQTAAPTYSTSDASSRGSGHATEHSR